MKKSIISLFLIYVILIMPISSYAAQPKFKLHIIKEKCTGVNYSINYPVIIDYDNDGDMDILIISKEGYLYFLENLTIL